MERNIKRGHCFVPECNCVVEKGEGFRRFVKGRGMRVFCPRHAFSLEDYHDSITYRADSIGTEKKLPLTRQTIGVEIEVDCDRHDNAYLAFRGSLERVGYCFESDCTVRGGEAPSPKMQGLAHISALLRNNENIFYAFTENTGAHIHTYCNDISYMRRYYHSLFVPLCEYIKAHDSAWMINTFGSTFRGYAEAITINTYPERHSNFVNVQHSNTLEFRLPRIRERHQFMNVVKFWREVGFMINNFDFHKNGDSNTRKRYAMKCGEEIVKLARKYFGE